MLYRAVESSTTVKLGAYCGIDSFFGANDLPNESSAVKLNDPRNATSYAAAHTFDIFCVIIKRWRQNGTGQEYIIKTTVHSEIANIYLRWTQFRGC